MPIIPLDKIKPAKKRVIQPPKNRPVSLRLDLRRLRTDKGVSLREAADASGVSHPTISRVEIGVPPDLVTALRLAEFYGKTVESIWKLNAGGN